MDLAGLVDLLDDLEERRTPVGWSPDDAVERVAIERRIMELVGGKPPGEERRRAVRLPCDMVIYLRSKHKAIRAQVGDIGAGGVFVKTDVSFDVGTLVEIEVRGAGAEEHGLRVRGEIAWCGTGDKLGVGVSFKNRPTAAHERRLRRFIIELLRHRVEG
jgi:Tfp pilus assembly protein PilZ